MISFNYGQKHKKELYYAQSTASKMDLPHDIIDLSNITNLISNSSLTSDMEVPDGHYAEENMKATVVPNRNMIMMSIAAGVAVNEKARTIGIGVHAGDHFIYPDCRPKFISQMEQAILTANEGFHDLEAATLRTSGGFHIAQGREQEYAQAAESLGFAPEEEAIGTIYAPFLNKTKADIAYRALELRVPFHETWSCYKGGEYHCGTCGTCVERLEAIHEALGRFDAPRYDGTNYMDTEFWKTAKAPDAGE